MASRTLAAILGIVSVLQPRTSARADRHDDLDLVQRVGPRDACVAAHRPVLLVLDRDGLARLEAGLSRLVAPAASVTTDLTSGDLESTLYWSGPGAATRAIPFRGASVTLPIEPRAAGHYHFHLELRDRSGRWQVRLPHGNGSFRLEVDHGLGPVVLDGSGDGTSSPGAAIPVRVQISGTPHVQSVTIHHWSADSSRESTAGMSIEAGDSRTATWRFSIPPPARGVQTVRYFVTITDTSGGTSRYGTRERPFTVRIAPLAPGSDSR